MTVHYDAVICIFRFKNYRYDAIYIYVYIYIDMINIWLQVAR